MRLVSQSGVTLPLSSVEGLQTETPLSIQQPHFLGPKDANEIFFIPTSISSFLFAISAPFLFVMDKILDFSSLSQFIIYILIPIRFRIFFFPKSILFFFFVTCKLSNQQKGSLYCNSCGIVLIVSNKHDIWKGGIPVRVSVGTI